MYLGNVILKLVIAVVHDIPWAVRIDLILKHNSIVTHSGAYF